MDLEKLATTFGLPGLLIVVWYLLELGKGKRLEKSDEAKAKLEAKRLEIEDKKVEAMTVGFMTIGAKLDEHTRVDLAHHAGVREDIAELKGALGLGTTPIPTVRDASREARASHITPVLVLPARRKPTEGDD